jgi:hypothetical protein
MTNLLNSHSLRAWDPSDPVSVVCLLSNFFQWQFPKLLSLSFLVKLMTLQVKQLCVWSTFIFWYPLIQIMCIFFFSNSLVYFPDLCPSFLYCAPSCPFSIQQHLGCRIKQITDHVLQKSLVWAQGWFLAVMWLTLIPLCFSHILQISKCINTWDLTRSAYVNITVGSLTVISRFFIIQHRTELRHDTKEGIRHAARKEEVFIVYSIHVP